MVIKEMVELFWCRGTANKIEKHAPDQSFVRSGFGEGETVLFEFRGNKKVDAGGSLVA